MIKAGAIIQIELQPKYPIVINGKKVFEYRADFAYQLCSGGRVIEDVKGVKTQLYKLKKKCVEAQYGITITEV